ncbi:DNA-directed DNA polymerase gamma mip1 [Chytridiales sp. JEL 0842]|nr:DNA-directed DNA polymerase gamma mip1 [Chytridiales sp. JEL 0842]
MSTRHLASSTFRRKPTLLRGLLSSCQQRFSRPQAVCRRLLSTVSSPTGNDQFRENEVGIQMLSKNLHDQIFLEPSNPADHQVNLARDLLEQFGLLGKQESPLNDIQLTLPKLLGQNIEEHFHYLGQEQAYPYLTLSNTLAKSSLPEKPKEWSRAAGWTRYETITDNEGKATIKSTPVPFPDDDMLVFDIENLFQQSPYPVLAVAASPQYWYSWVAPELAVLFRGRKGKKLDTSKTHFQTLIPMGNIGRKRIIVGHNVSYDRARVEDEYYIESTETGWIDTMSLHSSISGLSSQQRHQWMKFKKSKSKVEVDEDDELNASGVGPPQIVRDVDANRWMEYGSMNNLKDVVNLHLGIDISKDLRAIFETGTVEDIVEEFQSLMTYCSDDVSVTHLLFAKIFPKFLEKCPHPVSVAGMINMGNGYLPTSEAWHNYIQSAEDLYQSESQLIEVELLKLADAAVKYAEGEKWKKDPWLQRLDWSLPSARAKVLPDKPKWYRDLWVSKEKQVKISLSKRVVPYLLKLEWSGYPLHFNPLYGWMYKVPTSKLSEVKGKPVIIPTDENSKGYDPLVAEENGEFSYFRVPHKDGEDSNCGNPLSKTYLKFFEDGLLTSKYPSAKEILLKHTRCSYWISARQRVQGQLVVQPKPKEGLEPLYDANDKPIHIILPQTVVMGTVTRRAVERTWMTAANAKGNRIGSELKTLIRAPKGYEIVGADVDSEELWICSAMGDAQFGIHGATPLGFQALQGSKSKRTDIHSATGDIVGISRDIAKVFNYSRIYGAGLKHSVQLLLQHSPGMEKEEANKMVNKLFEQTKGKRANYKPFGMLWHGGSESHMFTILENIARTLKPTTPVLGSVIPDSLMPRNCKNDYMTSRVNWTVQSSGVDYLHLLLVSMNYLMRRMKIQGRFMLSIHDEVRFLVKKEHAELTSLALHISNLWTRAMFSYRLGIKDLPLNVAFFSAVDIDHCLRKEVDMDCITPSNPTALTKGRKLDIYETLESLKDVNIGELYGEELETINNVVEQGIANPVGPVPIYPEMDADSHAAYLKAQMCKTAKEVENVIKDLAGFVPKPKRVRTKTASSTTKSRKSAAQLADSESTLILDDMLPTSEVVPITEEPPKIRKPRKSEPKAQADEAQVESKPKPKQRTPAYTKGTFIRVNRIKIPNQDLQQ